MRLAARHPILRLLQYLGLLALAPAIIVLLVRCGSFAFDYLRARPIDLKTDCAFPFDPDNGKLSDIPAWIRRLDGRRVSIDGFMVPQDQDGDITMFAIVPGLFFTDGDGGVVPAVQQCVFARMPPGTTTPYCPDRLRVRGILHVQVTVDDGYVVSIFDLTPDSITSPPEPGSRWPYRLLEIGVVWIAAVAGIDLLFARRLHGVGHCQTCGYDLRATPDRCPECGAVPQSKIKEVSPQMQTDGHR